VAKEDEILNTDYPLFNDGFYTEVVHESGEKAIRILKGVYKDIIFQYGTVELVPREDEDFPTINFERAVRSCPEELIETISEDKIFNQLMTNILIELIANEGIKELNYGLQQEIQSKVKRRDNI
jgi:hypothetical protein